MTAPRPKCACCGKPYGVRVAKEVTVQWPRGQRMPAYKGQGIVVKTIPWPPRAYGKAPTYLALAPDTEKAYRHIWDGLTWSTPYKPFCTLRCALAYARASYEAIDEIRRNRVRS